MSLSAPFIRRPIATTLLTVALALAGAIAYRFLPVSPLPQVEFPTIQVSAGLPGATPETMASSVATPLERQFGRIAGVTEMTSTSSLGSTHDHAAVRPRTATSTPPRATCRPRSTPRAASCRRTCRTTRTYRKVNPADAPIMLLALTSDVVDRARMYDVASSILQQKLAQVEGVGQVFVGGGALPAVRVDVNPTALNNNGLGLEDVRTAPRERQREPPEGRDRRRPTSAWSLATTDQLLKAAEYRPLVIPYQNGAALRLSDVATVTDSVEDIRTAGLSNGKPAVLLIIFRQPGANIIETVDRIRALLPQLQAAIPPAINLSVAHRRDARRSAPRSTTSQITLLISIALVILVVFVFLRDVRATLIPSVAVPVSLIGTFGVMYLLGYSIDNLSLMALTIATGFVVDDAIVVIENITRHLEQGMTPLRGRAAGRRRRSASPSSRSASRSSPSSSRSC